MKVLVILLVLVGFAGIAFAAPGFTSQEIHDFSDIIAVGEVTYVDSTFSPTMNLYHIQVEKPLKNPQDSTEILAVGSKTESIRAGNEVFDVGDRALFFLTDDIASIFPIYSEIYEISTVSQSMDPNWDKCNIFEKNIPPNHWVFGGRNNHLQVSQENKTDDFVTGKKITISYDVFNHEPVTKKVDFGMMVKNIDEHESLYEFTETADRILEPCTVYETISWSFTPSEPANYLAEFYDLKGHTTGITIPVKSDTGFSGVAPLKQWGNDIPFDEIQCKQNLALIQKYDGMPACVTESTKAKLVERGWTDSTMSTKSSECSTDMKEYPLSKPLSDVYANRLVLFMQPESTASFCVHYKSNLDNTGTRDITPTLYTGEILLEKYEGSKVSVDVEPKNVSLERGTETFAKFTVTTTQNSTGVYHIIIPQLSRLPIVVWEDRQSVGANEIPVYSGFRSSGNIVLDAALLWHEEDDSLNYSVAEIRR